MADNKERSYNIPLRQEWLKVPRYKRASKAVRAVREFIKKHMKSDNVKIGKYLNKELWKRGDRKPPHKVSVIAKWIEEKNEKFVKVELIGAPEEKPKEEKKKKSLLDKVKEKAEEKEKLKEEKKSDKKIEKNQEQSKKEAKKVDKTKPESKKEEKKVIEKENSKK